jgi:hypothetical protein
MVEKIALRAIEAKALAEKAGLIAQPGSQWRWALRHLRSGKGELLGGKALAKAKEHLGKLPNNVVHNVNSFARKQKLGVEVAATLGKGNKLKALWTGSTADAMGITKHEKFMVRTGPFFDPGVEKTIHTHPGGDKMLALNSAPDAHLSDPVGMARPSGKNKLYHPKAFDWKPKRNATETNVRISTGKGGDMNVYKKLHEPQGSYKKVHSILAGDIEGTHKIRLNIPGALRSTYWKNN